jgi:hypothetical protein
MASGNPKQIGVFVNALTGEEIIRELTPEEIAELPEPPEPLEQ